MSVKDELVVEETPVEAPTTVPLTLPNSALIMALVSFATLYLTAGELPFVIVLGVCAVASYAVKWRLPGGLPSLLIRAFLISLAYVFNATEAKSGTLQIGPALGRNLLGQIAAVEVTIQFWRYRPQDRAYNLLMISFASGIILLAAANTFDTGYFPILAGCALVLGGLTLRRTRARGKTSTFGAIALNAAICLAMVFSLVGGRVLQDQRSTIMDWSNRFISERLAPEETGMSSQPVLGPMFNLRGSTARILRLRGYSGEGHLRGLAYSTYRRGSWYPTVNERRFDTPSFEVLDPPTGRRGSEIRVERLAGDNPILYLPLGVRAVTVDDLPRMDWEPNLGGPLRARLEGGSLGYQFYGVTEHSPGLLARPFVNSDLRAQHLEIPLELEAVLEPRAKKIVGTAKSDRDKVERIVAYLLKNHSYSLNFQSRGGDPLEDFLTRVPPASAHCEFFASASAMLLRSVGVPTRYVVGYYAHETDNDGAVIVRQKDAHAWCEAWIDGRGWVTVEATPGDGLPENDPQKPEWWRKTMERIQDAFGKARVWMENRTPLQTAALLLIPIGLGAGTLFLQRLRRPPVESDPLRAPYPTEPQFAEMAARFERSLARAGVPPDDSRAWSELVASLPGSVRNAASAFQSLYERARFGPVEAIDGTALDASLAKFEADVAALPKKESSTLSG